METNAAQVLTAKVMLATALLGIGYEGITTEREVRGLMERGVDLADGRRDIIARLSDPKLTEEAKFNFRKGYIDNLRATEKLLLDILDFNNKICDRIFFTDKNCERQIDSLQNQARILKRMIEIEDKLESEDINDDEVASLVDELNILVVELNKIIQEQRNKLNDLCSSPLTANLACD